MDSLLFFCSQLGRVAGKNMESLFGVENVSLRKSEIFVNNKKGLSCENEHGEEIWPLGRVVLDIILNVNIRRDHFNLRKIINFEITLKKEHEGISGKINLNSKSQRTNFTIDIYKQAMGHSLTNVKV